MTTFFVTWQEPKSRSWITVARLSIVDGHYLFGYTKGAKRFSNFVPFGDLRDLKAIYISKELFPTFSSRIMPETRPEYSRYLKWAGLGREEAASIQLMARMGGARSTDQLQVYAMPEDLGDGLYRTVFFVHGIGHLGASAQQRARSLSENESLYAMLDIQNPHDNNAIALRTADPAEFLGYCPRYLAVDFGKLLRHPSAKFEINVKRVNNDKEAPYQFLLLCEALCQWPTGFKPCSSEEYQMISQVSDQEAVEIYGKKTGTRLAS